MDKKQVGFGMVCFAAGATTASIVILAHTSDKFERANENFKMRLGVISNVYERIWKLKNDPTVSPDEVRRVVKEENEFLNLVVNRPVL